MFRRFRLARLIPITLLLVLSAVAILGAVGAVEEAKSGERMAQTAQAFLASLTPEQRAMAVFDFDSEARFVAYGRSLKLITTLSGSILNFSRWVVAPDPDPPDRYRVEVHEARDFPEVLAHTTEGFINGLAGLDADNDGSARSRWAHERVRPDLLVFRMLDPILRLR